MYVEIPFGTSPALGLRLALQEREYAKKRMQLEGRKPRAPYTKAKIRKILTSWHIYALTALYV